MQSNRSEIRKPSEVTVIFSNTSAQIVEDWIMLLGAIILGVIIIFD